MHVPMLASASLCGCGARVVSAGLVGAGALLALMLTSAPLLAAPPQSVETAGESVQTMGPALDPGALEDVNAGASGTLVNVGNDGNVSGNTAAGIISGDNVIDGGAFANAAGINTVIQNSGSNVLIQNGTAVNVQFVDPTP